MSAALNHSGNLLMPKASATWLMDNTILTFKQIAEFTGFTEIEIEAAADGDIWQGIVGRHPIENGELTQDELDRCAADPAADLVLSKKDLPPVKIRAKGPRYTPVSKRGDKPDAISYILKQNPEISEAQICKLVGTTKPTIAAVRDRTHANASAIKPRHPADLGLCTFAEYDKAIDKGLKAAGKDPEAVRAERLAAEQQAFQESKEDNMDTGSTGGFDFSNFMPDTGSNTGD